MRGGAGPPPQLSWLPPAFEGGPGLRQRRRRRQRPRRPAEVKPGCGCLSRRGGGKWPAGEGGPGWATAAWSAGRLGILGARLWRAGGPCVLPQIGLPEAPAEVAPARCFGVLTTVGGRGSLPSGGRGPPRRSASGAGLAGAWGLFCPCSGDAPQGEWGEERGFAGLEGERGPRSGRCKARQDAPLNWLTCEWLWVSLNKTEHQLEEVAA